MQKVVIELEDTPVGGVSIHTTWSPGLGHPLSPAQAAALDIINRTIREWGLPKAGAVQASSKKVNHGEH